MDKKMRLIVLFIMGVFLITGCSTTTRVSIDSSPSNAQVLLDGKDIGTTPIHDFKIKNRVGKNYSILVKKDGYQVLDTKLKTEIKPASVIGTIFLILPVIWVEGPEDHQHFILIPEKKL